MKKLIYINFVFVMLLTLGCQGTTGALPIATLPITRENTATFIIAPTPTSNISPETQLRSQCLTVVHTLPSKIASSGVLVLESRVSINGRLKRESHLLDMITAKTTTLENGSNFMVSQDRKLMAYESTILDKQDRIIKHELVIANANGQLLKVVPWKDEWQTLLDWLDNQRLGLSLGEDREVGKPYTLLVLNPFTDEQQSLRPDLPKFFGASELIKLPYWQGWRGVIYNPTLTRGIYLHSIGENDEMYTYGLWDLTNARLIRSLDNVFLTFSAWNSFPMPVWSTDGLQFVFQGIVATSDRVEFELYKVSQDGNIEQLTHLTSVAYVWESSYSWSPDSRYITLFLGPPSGAAFEKTRIAVLDTITHDVTDYCIPISLLGGEAPLAPIWSPDKKQFLISDKDEENHWRVVLVDIEKGTAAQIATDMQAVGWMTQQP